MKMAKPVRGHRGPGQGRGWGAAWVLAVLLPESVLGKEGFSRGQSRGLTTCLNAPDGVPVGSGMYIVVGSSRWPGLGCMSPVTFFPNTSTHREQGLVTRTRVCHGQEPRPGSK